MLLWPHTGTPAVGAGLQSLAATLQGGSLQGGGEFLRLVTLLAALGVRWFAKSLNNLIIAPALISNFSTCIKDSDG